MQTYRVSWEIDIDADSPEEAARKAREIQLRPDSHATVFDLTDESGESARIDLLELDEADADPEKDACPYWAELGVLEYHP